MEAKINIKSNFSSFEKPKIFKNKNIESIRREHLEDIKELKYNLNKWEDYVNKRFYDLNKIYGNLINAQNKHNPKTSYNSESGVCNYTLTMRSFLDEIRLIDNYVSQIEISISNKLKGQKRERLRDRKETLTSNKIDHLIEESLKCLNDEKNNISIGQNKIPKKVMNQIPSSNYNVKEDNQFRITDKLFIELKHKVKEFSLENPTQQHTNIFLCIKTVNDGKKIIDNIKKYFGKFMIYKGDEGFLSIIGGETTQCQLADIMEEIDHIYFNKKISMSFSFLESIDKVACIFEKASIKNDKLETNYI